jgi:hypothetical protein
MEYVAQISLPGKPVVEINVDFKTPPMAGHVIEFFGNYCLRLRVDSVEHCFDFPSLNPIHSVLICSLYEGSEFAIDEFIKAVK